MHDFIGIGDIVLDSFIQLREAEIHDHVKDESKEICMSWGTKIPYEKVTDVPAVGNAANACVAAARLGLKSAFLTHQGKDEIGAKNLEALKKENVGTEFVIEHEDVLSNHHFVLSFKGERTILIKHPEYPYEMIDIGTPKWLYLSSLAENSLPFHEELEKYLDEHPEINFVFQPGTFQIRMGKEKMAGMYKRAKLFFCNVEEAQVILGEKSRDIKLLSEKINQLGPEIVCITDGADGSYAYDGKSKEFWFHPIYPDPKPPLDRTGAGDSFSSTFAIALALDKTIPEALSWGPINSMSVVQYMGAQEGLLNRDKLEKYLLQAPANYKPEKLN